MPGTYGTSLPTYRSSAVMAELKAILDVLPGLSMQAGSILGFDSSGNPTLQLGDATAAHENASIRVMPIPTWGKDIVGNTQNVYANHVIQISAEKSATTDAQVTLTMKAANLMGLLFAALRTGCRVELYSTTATDTVTASDTTGANAFANFSAPDLLMAVEPHAQYPLMGSM